LQKNCKPYSAENIIKNTQQKAKTERVYKNLGLLCIEGKYTILSEYLAEEAG
jgi:hypothetical protein